MLDYLDEALDDMVLRGVGSAAAQPFPYPLVELYNKAYHPDDMNDMASRFHGLIDLAEAIIKYLTVMLLGQYLHTGRPDAGVDK